tara:strand:- start:176 stop:931 length:756 start_codon:yes stop_codon:yes gene_type:complete
MANPSSRQGLIDYSLRRLGSPVIEINVDIDQLEDRIDEALQYWQEYHADATYRTYVPHLVGDSDVSREYIEVSADILSITRMFNISSSFGGKSNMFDIKYQMMLNDIADMQNFAGDLAYYDQLNQYLSLLDMTLNGYPQVTYARHMNRLYIHGDFKDKDIEAGEYLIFEAYKTVSTAAHAKVWNDMWLKEYSTALIKQQWGSNLIKFENMQLPGGVTLNGRQIYDDATNDVQRLQEKIHLDFEMPPDFYVG